MAQRKHVSRLSTDESVSEGIIRAVAQVKGVDPVDLNERLYDYVDPGALERLCTTDPDSSPRPDIQVSFMMAGCHVHVHGGRKVVVTSQSTPTPVREEAL